MLLPGSRKKEILRHAAAMGGAAATIRQAFPKATLQMAVADSRAAELAKEKLGGDIPIISGRTYELLAGADFAIAVSGTVTLEAAYLGVPMVICYRANRVVFELFRHTLASTRYFSLPNILAGCELVPELMPWNGRAEAISAAALHLLGNPQGLLEVSHKLMQLADPLKEPLSKPTCQAVAELVIQTMRAGA